MTNYFTKANHFALTAPAADTASGLAKGDVVGFTCVPDPQTGAPFYKELDGNYLVNLFYNSQADPVAKNPQEELPIILSDYRSGFGLEIYDYDDSKRYFSSYGCDLRYKGRAMLSYGTGSIAVSGWVTPTGFVDGASAWANETNAYDNDTGTSATDSAVGASSWSEYLELTIASANCSGVRVMGTVSGTPAGSKISVDVYYSAGWHNIFENTLVFGSVWMTLPMTATQAVTAMRIKIYNGDAGGAHDVSLFEADFFMESGTPTGGIGGQATFNGIEYVGVGDTLCKIKSTGDELLPVKYMGADITDLEVMTIGGVDYLFIALGFATAYQYMVAAETFTTSNAADNKYQRFQVVYTTAATMYGNDSNSTIRSTVNPLNAGTAWSVVTYVDNDAYDILELFTQSGALYIRKEDKPYYLNAAGAVQNDLAPECEPLAADTQDRAVTVWNGEIFYIAGTQSLVRIGTTNEWISPTDYCTNLSAFTGRIFDVAGDDRYLWALVDNSTKIELVCGRDETIDGSTSWVWHPYQEITMTGCNIAWVTSTTQKRLYIGSDTAGEALQYLPLPSSYGNIDADANKSFPISATAYYFETPFLHGRFKADTKAWVKVTATLGHAYDADIYWTIQYKKLQDSSYTNIGNLKGTATDRTHTLYLPVDASSNNPVSTMMRFKLIGVTDTTATTPILLNLDIRAILAPTRKDVIWAKVKVAKEMVTMGGKSVDKYAKLKACLDVSRDATYPVTMTDIDGSSIQVRFLELPSSIPWREPVTDESKRDYDYQYNLLMLKSPTS